MKAIKQVLGGDLKQFSMVFALVALLAVFEIWSGGGMLTSSNVQNLIRGNAYVLVLAIGMVMVIVIGHIDLSVGSVAAVVGITAAISSTRWGFDWWLALLFGLLVGVVIGAWHGFWLAKVGIPGFITTLAGMMIFRGLVIWLSGSVTIPVPVEFRTIGAGFLPEWGPNTGVNNSTLLLGILGIAAYGWSQFNKYRKQAKFEVEKVPAYAFVIRFALVAGVIAYATWLFGTGLYGTSFPIPGLILLVLVFIYHTLTQRTTFGRHVYAVGGNRVAAALSGVNVKRTYFLVMLNMSFLAAVAGILFVGRATAAGPTDGTMWELDAIAAVFIGGAAVSGGVGTVVGSVVGGLVMAVLNNGLFLMGIGADQQQIIKGLVLLAAVAFDVYNKQQGRPSITGRLFPPKNPSAPAEPATASATIGGTTDAPAVDINALAEDMGSESRAKE